MLKKLAVLSVIAISMVLSACDDADHKMLEFTAKWNRVGRSADHWLEQYSRSGDAWDRIALVFGFSDDYDGCTELADGLAQRFPQARYRCVPAN